jgi:PAS domain S-box-containing protein
VVINWSVLCPLGSLVLQERRQAAGWFAAFIVLLVSAAVIRSPFPVVPMPPPLITFFYVMNIGCVSAIISLLLAYFVAQTSRLQREALAVESARRFRTISEALAVPVVVDNVGDGAIRHANPAALNFLGLPKQGPIAAPLGEFVGNDDLATMNEAALRGEVHRRDVRLRRADGTESPVHLLAHSLEFDGNRCIIVSLIDLTAQVAAQAEIEQQREKIYQAEKLAALGSLLAGVAHELNNPLAVVVAQAALLEESAKDTRTIQQSTKIRAAAERCARIVKTFLAMVRQRPPTRAAIDVNDAVNAAVDLVGYGLRTAGVQVKRELADELPRAWADGDQIGQLLTNLVVNARQAMAARDGPRRLTLATAREAATGMVRIAISDSGPGVPVGIRTRIFEPFFTTKAVGVGTGLGLSVCRDIATSHGGTIELEDAAGGGACFIIRLPIDNPRAAVASAAGPDLSVARPVPVE